MISYGLNKILPICHCCILNTVLNTLVAVEKFISAVCIVYKASSFWYTSFWSIQWCLYRRHFVTKLIRVYFGILTFLKSCRRFWNLHIQLDMPLTFHISSTKSVVYRQKQLLALNVNITARYRILHHCTDLTF